MSKLTYSELIKFISFEDRYKYLKLGGHIGEETFGFSRYLNQVFYKSPEWRRFRRDIIVRDNGCDLAIPGREINGMAIVHHLNPITMKDILDRSESLMDPENVITISDITHKAIHYGDESLLIIEIKDRAPDDTCLWK